MTEDLALPDDFIKYLMMSPQKMAELVTANGPVPITVEDIQKFIADGAPVNGDGTINVLDLLAWLAGEYENRENSRAAREN